MNQVTTSVLNVYIRLAAVLGFIFCLFAMQIGPVKADDRNLPKDITLLDRLDAHFDVASGPLMIQSFTPWKRVRYFATSVANPDKISNISIGSYYGNINQASAREFGEIYSEIESGNIELYYSAGGPVYYRIEPKSNLCSDAIDLEACYLEAIRGLSINTPGRAGTIVVVRGTGTGFGGGSGDGGSGKSLEDEPKVIIGPVDR